MNPLIADRIRHRQYQSPGAARTAVAHCRCSPSQRKKLLELVSDWEASDETAAVVGGLPAVERATPTEDEPAEAPASQTVGSETEVVPSGLTGLTARVRMLVHLNEPVRVSFTLAGLGALASAVKNRILPITDEQADLVVRSGGVWEGPLWELIAILGHGKLESGAELVAHSEVEFLHRTMQLRNGLTAERS